MPQLPLSHTDTHRLDEISSVSPAIVVNGLVKTYGNANAVDSLTLNVPRGCFYGFLGPNGAGKTTTIRMLMGLIPPTAGSIEILGRKLPTTDDVRLSLGLVPDDTLLFDYLTGGEFIEFVGRLYGLPNNEAHGRSRELLALFEIDGASRKLIGEYSKGMRKRCAMAAALIHRPQLFLLDEPFEGVDAVGVSLMKNILLEQVRRGATIFMTSHVLDVVERLCDRILIMRDGRQVVEVAKEELHGRETLEQLFVRTVGASRPSRDLEWLR